jgi:hypothetical protein
MKLFFKLIAYTLHPLLLPSYATLILVYANPYAFANVAGGGFSALKIIFPLTFFFPVFALFLMKALNFVDDYYLADQKQRFMPYIAIMVFYIWAFLVVRKFQMPDPMNWMMLGSCIAIALAFTANAFLKISIHTVGAGCLAAVAVAANNTAFVPVQWLMVLVLVIAGLVGSCRLYLKAHEESEVYAGYFVGFIGMMMADWFV